MKIALVHNRYQQPGGEDIVFEHERKLLEDAGHRVVTYERSNHEIDNSSGLAQLGVVKRTVWASDSREEFARLLDREKPDLAHVHNTFMRISPSIYSACREAGVPVVQTLHNFRLLCAGSELSRNGQICEECLEHGVWRGVRYGCYRESRAATAAVALMLTAHRRLGTWNESVNCFIALSEFARAKFIAGGLPADRIFVKPNFVQPDPGPGAADRSYALFAGRFKSTKGVGTLLAAWALLRHPIPLWIVGGGPERPALEREAERLGLTNVTFRGSLPHAETVAAMHAARFLIIPSEWYESFPMTIAESFACGTPVLCSRLGSMREIVTDGCTGLHFTAGDAADLARQAEWAWNHPAAMSEMGSAARREYLDKYTAEANYSQLLGIYRRALAFPRQMAAASGG